MGYLAYRFGRVGATWLFVLCLFASLAQAKTYSDNGDGTVTDPTTGLTWMRCAMGQTWDGATCVGTVKTYTYDGAKALSGTVSFAGKSDWRLPNIRELQTIVDRSVSSPAIDQAAFPNTPSSYVWSGSPGAGDSRFGWLVYFGGGDANYYSGRDYDLGVRLVRGGQSFDPLLSMMRATSDYIDHGDGTATHIPTALMWKRCAEGQVWNGVTCTGAAIVTDWYSAVKMTSTYAGKSDWRLPTEDELLSLVDYTKTGPAINTIIFPATPSSYVWSGSPSANLSNFAWDVNFGSGYANDNHRLNGYGVRLVRGGQSFDSFTLSITQTGAGKVGSVLANIDCGARCTGSYTKGTRVILTATPLANFVGWGGECTGAASTCTVTMDAAKTVSADFKDVPMVSLSTSSLKSVWTTLCNKVEMGPVTLTNSGSAHLSIASIAASGDFSVTHNCGVGLGPGEFCSLKIAYAPTAVGAHSGTVTIVDDAGDSPHVINLSGGGIDWSGGSIDPSDSGSVLSSGSLIIGSGTGSFESTITPVTSPVTPYLPKVTLYLSKGWNLLGNSTDSLLVNGLFADSDRFLTVWKWLAPQSRWAVYAPELAAKGGTALADYAAAKGYLPLTTIAGGEGFWVNAKQATSLKIPFGRSIALATLSPTLINGWNLVSIGETATPKQFCDAQAGNVDAVWAWDASRSLWYFYAPSLDSTNDLSAYIGAKGYADFRSCGKKLGHGMGFWVNRR